MLTFTLLLGGDFHGVQESGNGIRADALAIHLSDGGDGSLLALVVDDLVADPPFAAWRADFRDISV